MEKIDLMVVRFPYGGFDRADITPWYVKNLMAMKADERVGEIDFVDFNDTPITMCRNSAVLVALERNVDFMLMVDNDMKPDAYLKDNTAAIAVDPQAVPFLPSSFDFLYRRRQQGKPPACVVAPYCGPPPFENVYVFRWVRQQSDHPNADMGLQHYAREEAIEQRGIQEVAAGPTGLILIDMGMFCNSTPPWFYYEWKTKHEAEKASTEDVTFTRDMSLNGYPCFCHWSSWCGHWKSKCVGRPTPINPRTVGNALRAAVLREYNILPGEEFVMVCDGNGLGRHADTEGAGKAGAVAASGGHEAKADGKGGRRPARLRKKPHAAAARGR